MIALTPQSLKRARFEFARNEFSQKSGKTNAPTIRLDGKAPLLDSPNQNRSPPLLAKRDDYHKVVFAVLRSENGDDRSCAGFWTPASRGAPLAPAAGVQKAPGHEVAGRLGPGGQPALWGFDASGEFAGGRETGATRAAGLDAERARGWAGVAGGAVGRVERLAW